MKFVTAKDLQLYNLATCKKTSVKKKKETTDEGFSQLISWFIIEAFTVFTYIHNDWRTVCWRYQFPKISPVFPKTYQCVA